MIKHTDDRQVRTMIGLNGKTHNMKARTPMPHISAATPTSSPATFSGAETKVMY